MGLREIAKILKEKIETACKGHPPEPQKNWTEPIISAIKDLRDSILEQSRTNQEQNTTDNKKNRRIAIWAVLGAWIYAFIALLQMCAMQDSVKEAKRAADAAASAAATAETALHVVEGADLDFLGALCEPQPVATTSKVSAVFRNVGRTRADDVEVQFWIGTSHKPQPIITKPSKTIVGANSPFQTEFRAVNFSEDTLILINKGESKLFLYGKATYKDVFGDAAFLEFDTTYVPKSTCDFRVTKITSHHERKK